MARVPFDPMQSAAMRAAQSPKRALPAEAAGAPLAESAEALFEELPPGGSAAAPLSVAELNALIAEELSATLPPVFFVQGEISNFRTYDRGHAFFTLKDAGAEMPCMMWKDDLQRMKFRPRDGQAVIARGIVKLYEPQGKIQLYASELLPLGTGALELAYKQLCEKLRAEGLFEAARKRPIPRLPLCIAVVTSRTGDVLHDVLITAYRRFPGLHTLIYPVQVQGAQAAPGIVRALQNLNRYNDEKTKDERRKTKVEGETKDEGEETKDGRRRAKIDLILLVRGGGSLEDLWAFNEEAVARAIVASRIPVATGIGHEPDTTIADYVADLRGPTPTGVTELTIPDGRVLRAEVDSHAALLTRDLSRAVSLRSADVEHANTRLAAAVTQSLHRRGARLHALHRQVERVEPRHAIAQGWRRVEEAQRRLLSAERELNRRAGERINRLAQRLERTAPLEHFKRHCDRLERLEERVGRGVMHRLADLRQRIEIAAAQLRAVSPQAVLERGYSITRDKEGRVVRVVGQVKRGDVLTTQLADGAIQSTVGKPRQESLF